MSETPAYRKPNTSLPQGQHRANAGTQTYGFQYRIPTANLPHAQYRRTASPTQGIICRVAISGMACRTSLSQSRPLVYRKLNTGPTQARQQPNRSIAAILLHSYVNIGINSNGWTEPTVPHHHSRGSNSLPSARVISYFQVLIVTNINILILILLLILILTDLHAFHVRAYSSSRAATSIFGRRHKIFFGTHHVSTIYQLCINYTGTQAKSNPIVILQAAVLL